MPFLGELAALTTASCWAVGSFLFSAAARRCGAFALNVTRISFALVVLSFLVLWQYGVDWIPDVGSRRLTLLMVSGWIGLTLGDWAYFGSIVAIGPRLSTLLMTLAPPIAAVLAIPLLGERLGGLAWLGMAVTISGVIWVVLERPPVPIPRGHLVRGLILAALGAFGQGLGLVLSKLGMGDVVDPLPATMLRMLAAMIGAWSLAFIWKRGHEIPRLLRNKVALWATLGATTVGPVVGVWMSLVAVRHTETGIAATLMATTPVFILPLVMIINKEHVSRRAAVGAIVAVAGVGLLFRG